MDINNWEEVLVGSGYYEKSEITGEINITSKTIHKGGVCCPYIITII